VGQNGHWSIVQDYSATSTYSWSTANLAAGTYGLEVDVRNQGSTLAYEKVANLTYTLSPCTAASLSSNKASPQAPGTIVVLTGGASRPGLQREQHVQLGHHGQSAGRIRIRGRRPQPRLGGGL
jgi:hypothetical protein